MYRATYYLKYFQLNKKNTLLINKNANNKINVTIQTENNNLTNFSTNQLIINSSYLSTSNQAKLVF